MQRPQAQIPPKATETQKQDVENEQGNVQNEENEESASICSICGVCTRLNLRLSNADLGVFYLRANIAIAAGLLVGKAKVLADKHAAAVFGAEVLHHGEQAFLVG